MKAEISISGKHCIECKHFRVISGPRKSLVTGKHEAIAVCDTYKEKLSPGFTHHSCESVRQWTDACGPSGVLWERNIMETT